ncbi:histone H2A-Bbd type 1 [Lycaon pictus]
MSGVHVVARELLQARRWRPMPSARRRASDFPPFLAGEGRANEDAVTSSDLRVTACAAGRGGVSLLYGAGPPRPLLRAREQPAQRAARRCTPALLSLRPDAVFRKRSPSARPVSPQPEVGLCSPRSDSLQPEARLSAARARGRCLSVRSPMSLQPKPHVPAARRPSVRSPGSPQPEARGSAARRPSVRSPGSPQPEARGSAARRPSVRSPGSPQPEARGSAARRPSVRSPGSPQPEARGSAARRPSVPSRAAAGPQPEAPRRAPPRPRTRLRGSRGGRAGRPRSCRSRSARAGLAFSVCQMERLLRAGRYAKRLGASAPIFLAAVIQFLTATVLGLAGDEARHRRTAYITPELVDRALHNHELLSGLFTMTTVSQVAPSPY